MQGSVFSQLDRLYTQILSQYSDSEVLVDTLGMILLLEPLPSPPNVNFPATIAAITGFGEVKLRVVLRALQSVTEIRSDLFSTTLTILNLHFLWHVPSLYKIKPPVKK